MEFAIVNNDRSIKEIMQLIGYESAHFKTPGEFSIVRQVGRNDYPKFHLYGNKDNSAVIFKLHLDQKKPLHEDGHTGRTDGRLVHAEVKRILNILEPGGKTMKT